jgi:hypothetical protein
MKTLEEKRLLLQMMRAFGQEDKDLAEQIRREEEFAKLLFKEEEKQVEEQVIEDPVVEVVEAAAIEELPPQPAKPAETNLQPPEEYKVNQVINYLDTVSNTKKPPLAAALQDNEFQALRKTVLDLLQKVNTLSWGGGGTGAVRIFDQDDFDRNSVGNGKYMKWQDGWFVMDEINPFEVVHNTTLVTSNTYVVTDSDYYIGVNVPEYTTIILPLAPDSGRMLIIKDESGFAQLNPIKLDGNVDNDPNGAEIRINNGGVQLIYRNGWRIV